MKCNEMHLVRGLLVGLLLMLAACSGGSAGPTAEVGEIGEATESVVAEESDVSTVVPEVVPTATVELQPVAEAELIAAAVAAVERDGTVDLFAADVLESSIREDGKVRLVLCGWTGDTVFDARYQSLWTVNSEAGELTATELTTSKIDGECLNSELIDSALATVDAYGEYWTEMTADPAKIATDPRTDELLSRSLAERAREAGGQWVTDGVSFRGVPETTPVRDSVASLLFDRYRTEEGGALEIALCRQMATDYGLYRNDVLIDDLLSADSDGPHSVVALVVRPELESSVGWRVFERQVLVRTNCADEENWASAASVWSKNEVEYSELDS